MSARESLLYSIWLSGIAAVTFFAGAFLAGTVVWFVVSSVAAALFVMALAFLWHGYRLSRRS